MNRREFLIDVTRRGAPLVGALALTACGPDDTPKPPERPPLPKPNDPRLDVSWDNHLQTPTPAPKPTQQATAVFRPPTEASPSPVVDRRTPEATAALSADVSFLKGHPNITAARRRMGTRLVVFEVGLTEGHVDEPEGLWSRYLPIYEERTKSFPLENSQPLAWGFETFTTEIIDNQQVQARWATLFWGKDGYQANSLGAYDLHHVTIHRSDHPHQYVAITKPSLIRPKLVTFS